MNTIGNATHPDLVYICDWLPPDFGAVGQYSELFTREIAESGRGVVLIGLTSGSASDKLELLGQGWRRTIKLPISKYDKSNLKSRIAWTIRANTKLLISAWSSIRYSQEILFTGSPPFFLHWIAPTNMLLRKKIIYRITDFFPECVIAELGGRSIFIKLIYALTLFWRRRVHTFEVLGHDQAARLREIGIPDERIRFKADPSPVEIHANTKPLKRPAGFEDKFLLLYSGNWGVAHDYSTFTRAYIFHHQYGTGRVILWLNAVGNRVCKVSEELRTAGVPFISGAPVLIDELASLLVTPDAHLITLSDAFVGYVLPSKVHGCIESGRPVLFVGSDKSDVHRLCDGSVRHYVRVDVGDVSGCAAALEKFAAMSAVKVV